MRTLELRKSSAGTCSEIEAAFEALSTASAGDLMNIIRAAKASLRVRLLEDEDAAMEAVLATEMM